jgi:tyrosyl-tRNA synthetase
MEKLEGMSFSEFCYPALQAFDWWHMYRHHGVQLQIGGADQYGNILSGIDGIKNAVKLSNESEALNSQLRDAYGGELPTPMGFTVPLLTTPSGEKFGKSAGNAIWLDKELTSVFDLHGVSFASSTLSTLQQADLFLVFCGPT